MNPILTLLKKHICPNCNSPRIIKFLGKGSRWAWRCDKCKHVFPEGDLK